MSFISFIHFLYSFLFIFRVMIKCDLNICAVVSRAASVKNGKEGNSFLSLNVKLPVEGRDGSKKDLEMSVSLAGDKSKAPVFSVGRRVSLVGTLSVRKRAGKVYYNFHADKAELANSKDADLLDGTMEFLGKVGKKGIEEKKDKNGSSFKVFSAFSSDKDGDNVEFTWVRFIYFNPKDGEDFLQANAYVKVKGDLQVGVYKDDISLDCRVSEVEPWVLNK